jgi:hypothetical protein
MFRLAVRSPRLGLFCALGTVALLAWLPGPSAANVLPESALLMHVQPVSGTCATSITSCEQIEDTAPTLGTWEFLLFFMPIHWQQADEPIDIRAVDCELVWPEGWQFVEGELCGYWGDQLDLSSPPYHLHYDYLDYYWDCPDLPIGHHDVFLVARFVFNVTEPGRFGFASTWGNAVTLDCANPFPSYAKGCGAEVALPCGYTHIPCGYGPSCYMGFSSDQLVLHAPPGGTATGETELWTDLCDLRTLTTMADWLTASATYVGSNSYQVLVTADASSLAIGTYESWVLAEAETIGRCLPVTFIVGDTTPTDSPSWGAIKALYR